MVKATAALEQFLNSSGFVCSVCGPAGSGKLTLVTRMAIANGFELVEFEPGKAEANSNKTLDECVPEPRKVAYFWRGNQLPPDFEPGGTKLFVIGRWKCPGLPFVQVPPPTDVEMHQAVDAFLTGNVTGPAGCDWHDAMMLFYSSAVKTRLRFQQMSSELLFCMLAMTTDNSSCT